MAVAGNTEVVCAKLRAMRSLELDDTIHDILITLGKQYHIIPPLAGKPPFVSRIAFALYFRPKQYRLFLIFFGCNENRWPETAGDVFHRA